MPRVAVVDSQTNIVAAIIIADAGDPPYDGTFLVDVDNMACGVGWVYDPVINDFTDPNPPPAEDEEPAPDREQVEDEEASG